MPSHKKLRPRRAVPTFNSENAALDGATLQTLHCCHPDQPPLHGANGHNRHRAFSSDEKISNLMQLNDTLVKKLSSMQNGQSETSAKIKSLEEHLQTSRSTADGVLMELARLQHDVVCFKHEKTSLLAEKDELDDALSDLSIRQQQLKEELEAERKASSSYQSEVRALTNDVKVLRMDNEKLVDQNKKLTDENEDVIEECHGLKSENNEIQSKLKILRSKETTLEEKHADLGRLYNEELLKAADAKKTIEVLQTEVSRGNEALVVLEGQLHEAFQRIKLLETQHAAAIESQCLLESHVKGLENDLLTERDEHDQTASTLEQERRAKEVGIRAVACEIDKLRVDKEKLIDENIGYKSVIAGMQNNIKDWQAKEVKLEEELANERNANAAAQLEVTNANESIKALRDAATIRDGTVSKLEGDLVKASQRIAALEMQSATATDMQSELELQVCRLQSELNATRTELLNASSALEQEREAKEDEICSLTCKVEHLRLDKEKLIEKNNALSAKNSGFQSGMKQLQSKEAALGKEVTKLRNSYSSAQSKINDMNKTIKTLESEALRRNADAAKFVEQLKESSQHIECLETQSAVSSEMQQKLELRLRALQNDLLEHEMQAKELLDSKVKEVAKLEEQLQSQEATHGKEVTKLRSSDSSAQLKIDDMNKTIKTLESEAAQVVEQLKESSHHIARLETQSAASSEVQQKLECQLRALQNDFLEQEMQARELLDTKVKEASNLEEKLDGASKQMTLSIERQAELETQIRALQSDLLASSNAHLSASSALEKEMQARASLERSLEASQAKSRSLVDHLESVKSCLLGKHYNSNTDPQSFQSLQSQLACLVDEKRVLEETKTALEKKVSLLNAKSTQASLKAKVESDKLAEQLKQLELALNDAKEEASERDNKFNRLEADLRRAKVFLEEKSKLVRSAIPVAVASTSALIFVGLLSYF